MQRRFQIVDVFAGDRYAGNPLAVVLDAEGLTTEKMQLVTRWLNLSETAFVLPATTSDADYRLRIFTLDREMPFAGHPTLGSCHAWLSTGGRPQDGARIVQECGLGLVPLRRLDTGLSFCAPPLIKTGPLDGDELQEVASVLRIDREMIVDAQWADNGPGWIAVLLPSADDVRSVEPAGSHPKRFDVGLVGPYPQGNRTAFELRAFFTDHLGNVREDPITGSLNAAVAQWLISTGRATAPYVASQGQCVGRKGLVHVTQDHELRVWIGGSTVTLVEGGISI